MFSTWTNQFIAKKESNRRGITLGLSPTFDVETGRNPPAREARAAGV
jgi:hypothetical protein